MKKQIVKILDYEIVNTGNGDGWVLQKPNGELWECHLGNFTSAKDAEEYAVYSFMIARPEVFHGTIRSKIIHGNQSGTCQEYFLLKRQLKKEGLEMPACLKSTEDSHCTIQFVNKTIDFKTSIKQEITKIADRLSKAPVTARGSAPRLYTQTERSAQQIGMLESEIVYAAAKLETILKELS